MGIFQTRILEWVATLSSGHTPTLTQCKEQASPPSGSEQAMEPVTCSGSPCEQGLPVKLWLNFCLASSQFLLIGEGQEPWSVTV